MLRKSQTPTPARLPDFIVDQQVWHPFLGRGVIKETPLETKFERLYRVLFAPEALACHGMSLNPCLVLTSSLSDFCEDL